MRPPRGANNWVLDGTLELYVSVVARAATTKVTSIRKISSPSSWFLPCCAICTHVVIDKIALAAAEFSAKWPPVSEAARPGIFDEHILTCFPASPKVSDGGSCASHAGSVSSIG